MSEDFKQEIFFSGGMNSVSDPRLLPEGDYLPETRNVRIGATASNTMGSVQSMLGNLELTAVSALLSGTGVNKCVGQVEDIKNKATIMFIWNSLSGIFYRNLASSALAPSITVSGAGWTVNQWIGYRVRIVSGLGVNQVRGVLSNTATKITIDADWDIIPDITSQFVIEFVGHQIIRYFYQFDAAERVCYEPCLNFDRHTKIHSAVVISDLLYWTQDNEPQKKTSLVLGGTFNKSSYKFRLYIGEQNPGQNTTYTVHITGTFPTAPTTLSAVVINYAYVPGDTLREVLKAIAAGLNADVPFAGKFFVATYLNDCVEVSNANYAPAIIGGIWNVVTTASTGQLWWVGQNFYSYINEETLDVLKWPAWIEPQISMRFDPAFLYNYLKGTRFQFAVRHIYVDGEQSRYGPFSVMALDSQVLGSDITATNKNYVQVDYSDNGRLQAKRNILSGVEIAVRDSNTLTFKKIANLNPSQLTGIFNFYNDSAYNEVPDSDTLSGQDYIPRSSKAEDIIDNRINFANNLEGFDNIPVDVKLVTTYTEGQTGPKLFTVTGALQIKDPFSSAVVGIAAGKFGDFAIPALGFTVYLAGTEYHALTVQTGSSGSEFQNFVITGVPAGRYYLRVASHLCKTGSTWGREYETGNPADLSYQKTSTFLSGLTEYEILITNADYLLGPVPIIHTLPTSNPVVIALQSKHLYGYVYDGQNATTPVSVTGANIRNGYSMELATVDFIFHKIDGAYTPVTVTSCINGVFTASPTGLSIGDRVYFAGFTATYLITNISGTTITIDTPINFSSNHTLQRLEQASETVTADHNGFFFAYNTDVSNDSLYVDEAQAYYPFAVIKNNSTQHSYVGNISPETPILVLGRNNTIDPGSANNQADNIVFLPNYNVVISQSYRTTVAAVIQDPYALPVENILVSISQNGRQIITGPDGIAKIIVYCNTTVSSVAHRDFDLLLGNPNPFAIATYTITKVSTGFSCPPQSNSTIFYVIFQFSVNPVISTRYLSWLKHGAKYRYGIVYYDRGNRRGYVNASQYTEVAIPFWVANPAFVYMPIVSWSVFHRPPVWATHYSWVRTKNLSYNDYLQMPIQSVAYILDLKQDGTVKTGTTYANNNALYIDLSIQTLDTYKNYNQKSILDYSFVEGDRVRLIKDQTDTFYNQYMDFEIVSYDTTTFVLRVKNIFTAPEIKMDASTKLGPTIEIYSPIKLAQESLYFEICQTLEVGNPYTATRFHKGITVDQSSDLVTAAQGNFNSGDTYLVQRTVNIYDSTTPHPEVRYFESPFLSDFIVNSDDINIGRPNIVNLQAKEQWLETGIRASRAIFINTQTNGLSTFDNDLQVLLPVQFGPINKIIGVGYILKVYQNAKKTSIYIGRVFAQSADGGTGNLTTIKGYYGSVNPSEEGYGCIQPESVIQSDTDVYFFDAIQAVFIRDSTNGMVAISDPKMSTYASDKADQVLTIGSKAKCYAAFDSYYEEVYFSFVDESDSPDYTYNDTIVYQEKKNAFAQQLDLWKAGTPNKYPDYLGTRGKVLVSWLDGKMYKHNDDTVPPANFYGTQHTPQVRFASNASAPDAVKVFDDITVNANKVWFAPNAGEVSIPASAMYPNGMSSRLLENIFKGKEGVYYASFKGDLNTVNVINPILNGRRLRGQAIIIILKSKVETPNTESVLMSVIIKATPSPKTI